MFNVRFNRYFYLGRRYSQAFANKGGLERKKPTLIHLIWGRRANSHFVLFYFFIKAVRSCLGHCWHIHEMGMFA